MLGVRAPALHNYLGNDEYFLLGDRDSYNPLPHNKKINNVREAIKQLKYKKINRVHHPGLQNEVLLLGSLLFFTKFLLVFLTVLTSSLQASSQGALLILFFLFLFLIQERIKPYNYDEVNKLKTISYITTICSAGFAIMASSKSVSAVQRNVCILFSLGSTLLFYISWTFKFIQIKKQKTGTSLVTTTQGDTSLKTSGVKTTRRESKGANNILFSEISADSEQVVDRRDSAK
jgi:hypothetical protein